MKLLFNRSILSYNKVQRILGLILRNKKIQASRYIIPKKKYLNVGCGPNINAIFINLDYRWRPGIDLCWDIRNIIPLSDGSIKGIFSEHCLEHIGYEECVKFLNDAYRMLDMGGTIRIVVPDGGLYLDLYNRAKSESVEFPYVGEDGRRDLESDSIIKFTAIMAVNRIFRGYGHQFAYDAETLINMLAHAGFKDIRQESFRAGRDEIMLIDSELRRPQSLYVEASK